MCRRELEVVYVHYLVYMDGLNIQNIEIIFQLAVQIS